MGGYKTYVMEVKGKQVYSKLKFESGVHRVQRVPLTETMGRVHTSTATVAIMPEVDHFDICVKFYDMNSLFLRRLILFQWHSRLMKLMWLLIQKILSLKQQGLVELEVISLTYCVMCSRVLGFLYCALTTEHLLTFQSMQGRMLTRWRQLLILFTSLQE